MTKGVQIDAKDAGKRALASIEPIPSLECTHAIPSLRHLLDPPIELRDDRPEVTATLSQHSMLCAQFERDQRVIMRQSIRMLIPRASPKECAWPFPWPDHVSVLTSSSAGETSSGYFHLQRVLKHIKASDSLPEAFRRAACEIYQSDEGLVSPRYHPAVNQGWSKSENVRRAVLMFSGSPNSHVGRQALSFFTDYMQSVMVPFGVLKAIESDFSVSGDRIRLLGVPSQEEIRDGFRWLGQQCQDDPATEVLVAVYGHGGIKVSGEYIVRMQRTDQGSSGSFVSPRLLSDLIERYLPASQTSSVSLWINSCFSGHFVTR